MPLPDTALSLVLADSVPAAFLRVVLILAATVIASRVFDRFLQHHFRAVSRRMEIGRTSYRLIRRLITMGIYIVGFALAVYTVPGLRNLSFALFASAGFMGIVLGFAAQQSLGNIIAGVFIAIFDPFHVGDRIETQQHYGEVEDITLRQTIIKTPSNERVIVPNASILDDYIINYSITEEKSRYDIQISIAYGESIDEAREIMLEEADDHELTETGESEVIVDELSDSSVVLELRLWSEDRGEAWRAGQDLRESIKKRFDEEGVKIPFPQRTLSGEIDTSRETDA
ncbi:MAG: mechanosensitive ion channel family protein [Candidatus Nanohaloarchaea archaeon]